MGEKRTKKGRAPTLRLWVKAFFGGKARHPAGVRHACRYGGGGREAEDTPAEVESDIDFNSASAGDPNGFQLPEDPDDLLKQGWEETTDPRNQSGNREFRSPDGKLRIRFDKAKFDDFGNPLDGFRGMNHYHIHTYPKPCQYFDKFGNTVIKGTNPAHLIPGNVIIMPNLP